MVKLTMSSESTLVWRSEAAELQEVGGWLLVYGRRKTGKSTLVHDLISWDSYLWIRRDRSVISEGVFIREPEHDVVSLLRKGKTVVVDEFQRLPSPVLETWATAHPRGRLILVGSALHVVHRTILAQSPLLGLVAPFRIGLLRPIDIVGWLANRLEPAAALEIAALLREPWLIPYWQGESSAIAFLIRILHTLRDTVPALIGETFLDQDRQLTTTYLSILQVVGAGEWQLAKIAQQLAARQLISSPSAGAISGFVNVLLQMDLLQRVRLYRSAVGRQRWFLRPSSTLLSLYFYLNDKLNLAENPRFSRSDARVYITNRMGVEIERFIGELLAELYDAELRYCVGPHGDVDVVLIRLGKPLLACEVKWGSYSQSDINTFLRSCKRFGLHCPLLLIARERGPTDPRVTIVTADELVTRAQERYLARQSASPSP